MRMGDVNGDPTTVLERGYVHLKDNRIPPLGFNTSHPSYDSVRIVGTAESDLNFNRLGNFQGTGADVITYKLAINELSTNVSVSARVYYQSVPPYWLDEMRMFAAPEINSFLGMYDAADGFVFTGVVVPSNFTPEGESWCRRCVCANVTHACPF
jgi:hypothetical protein